MNLNNTKKPSLSAREMQIIELLAYECSAKEIADELYLGTETIKTHLKNIRRKLNVKNAAGVVRAAFEHNILKVTQVA